RGRLAAARGADEDEELAVLDVQVERVDCGALRAGVDPGCLVIGDSGHDAYIPPPAGTCRTIRCRAVCQVSSVTPARLPRHATVDGVGHVPRATTSSCHTPGPRRDD